jgi:hypothetical protein
MKTRVIVAAMTAACFVLVAGCNNSSKDKAAASNNLAPASMSVVNSTCPVSGHAVDSSAQTVSYKGKNVGFCCDGCQSKWAKMTDVEKDAWMKKQMEAK